MSEPVEFRHCFYSVFGVNPYDVFYVKGGVKIIENMLYNYKSLTPEEITEAIDNGKINNLYNKAKKDEMVIHLKNMFQNIIKDNIKENKAYTYKR